MAKIKTFKNASDELDFHKQVLAKRVEDALEEFEKSTGLDILEFRLINGDFLLKTDADNM